MREFADVQTTQLAALNTSGKFIIFDPIDAGGLGNRYITKATDRCRILIHFLYRIPPLVSCFIMALIMKRGFLVHWDRVDEFDNNDNEHVAMVEFSQISFVVASSLLPEMFDRRKIFNTPVNIDALEFPYLLDLVTSKNSIFLEYGGMTIRTPILIVINSVWR